MVSMSFQYLKLAILFLMLEFNEIFGWAGLTPKSIEKSITLKTQEHLQFGSVTVFNGCGTNQMGIFVCLGCRKSKYPHSLHCDKAADELLKQADSFFAIADEIRALEEKAKKNREPGIDFSKLDL